MKQVCLMCDRTALNHNLYCQEIYCPAEQSPTVLSYGKWLGAIEIVRPVMILRTAVLYEARQHHQKVFIKIAHTGSEHINRLKREAEFLKAIKAEKKVPPTLPVWLPPHSNQEGDEKAYGRAVLGEQLLYYYITEYVIGEPLRDVLTKIPQLWIYHIGWIMTQLTAVVAYLQSKGRFHFALSPDVVLVHFQNDTSVPKVMLFDLGVISEPQTIKDAWYPAITAPAYTAPELMTMPISTRQVGYQTDTYGLGLIFYELLVGQPCYGYKLLSDEQVKHKVLTNQPVRMNRLEDVKPIAQKALKAVERDSAKRYPDAETFATELLAVFGHPPQARFRWVPSLQTTLIAIISLLTIAFVITFIITLHQLNVF